MDCSLRRKMKDMDITEIERYYKNEIICFRLNVQLAIEEFLKDTGLELSDEKHSVSVYAEDIVNDFIGSHIKHD
jgi:hypothetical protein